ncbi:multicopper oxidase type 3 [Roseibium sp. TrichSKD4]|uniref:multicopper oxidase family protein n=1 Tax=Roseibium sp. TrichSKD4 TaxID=744980 RepID=UPI0001E573CA|nr:multicopper oxidase family protein [Roseibium sp. TrichSKD4]EFO29814.1 multicopper oxidase type 3 [Roseibium sp. TrichSKD4]
MTDWTSLLNRRQMLAFSGAALATAAVGPTFHVARADDGFLEIAAGPAKKKLLSEGTAEADLWLFGGSLLGPEIRVTVGERVKVRLVNNLEEPTSIHWHGIRIQNDMDGVSGLTQEAVAPGESFEYDFVAPDAGTYWYHAHNRSWNQVGRGLYGALIVEEVVPVFDREHDLTVVIDDWRILEDGNLDQQTFGSLMDWSHAGRLGNFLTINGVSDPEFRLSRGEKYRLRLINVANARVMPLNLATEKTKVLAYDGQSLPEPEEGPPAEFFLGPAQRVDVMVEADEDFSLNFVARDDSFPFARFNVTDSDGSQGHIVWKPAISNLPEPDLETANTYSLEMTGGAMGQMGEMIYNGKVLERSDMRETGQLWAFNGVANLAKEPFFSVQKGETVVIDLTNNTAFEHAMHTHGHHFRIVEREGAEADESAYWRDTFLILPRQRVKIAFVADNPGKWLFHCHMLEHAAAGMNTWFEVV